MRLVLLRLPLLAGVALRVTLPGLLALAPLLLVAFVVGATLLSRHDINFYLDARPPAALAGLGAILVAGLLSLALLVRLVARIRLAVQVALFEHPT